MSRFLADVSSGMLFLLGILMWAVIGHEVSEPLGFWLQVAGGAMTVIGLDWRIRLASKEKK
ncbi:MULTISPECIES: hypothetical protein [unclassified Microbacterium]|uniref:hypothetical protein n=1 Tax=unclassified Microbacterium TaxID=2609290 RepID=UPI00300F8440